MKKALMLLLLICLSAAVCITASADDAGSWTELLSLVNRQGNTVSITLTANISNIASDRALTIPSGKTVTIDLNGCTLDRGTNGITSAQNIICIDEGATCILQGSGTITDKNMNIGPWSLIENYGTLKLDGPTLDAFTRTVLNYGTVTMESGCMKSAYQSAVVNDVADTSFTMNGGIIENCYYYAVDNKGTFIMNGGMIRENGHTEISGSGTIEIAVENRAGAQTTLNGGSITGNKGAGIWNHGTLIMNDCAISDNRGGGVDVFAGASMVMSGGTISGNGFLNYDEYNKLNTAKSGAGLDISGTVTMTGGTISGNKGFTAVQLSGSAASFTMTGGSIKNNQAAGIWPGKGQLNIGGNIGIGQNTNGEQSYAYDIRVSDTPIHLIGELSRDLTLQIEVTARPSSGNPVIKITDGFLDEQGVPRAYVSSFDFGSLPFYRVMQDGEIAILQSSSLSLDEADFVLPEDVTMIDAEAFAGTDAEVICVPKTDKTITIGSKAFVNCYHLRQIYLPSNVTSIAADAFDEHTVIVIFGDAYGTAAQTFAGSHDNCLFWLKQN